MAQMVHFLGFRPAPPPPIESGYGPASVSNSRNQLKITVSAELLITKMRIDNFPIDIDGDQVILSPDFVYIVESQTSEMLDKYVRKILLFGDPC